MKKRSVLAMVMAMGMVMGLAVPASAAENYKIAWVDGNLANESNAICTDAAKAYAEENNVDFTLLDGQGSGENQVSQIETLIAQGVDCIIVQPYDAEIAVNEDTACYYVPGNGELVKSIELSGEMEAELFLIR